VVLDPWLRVFPCGCEFSTCTCLRQDEILSPQETPASDPQLVPSQCFLTRGCEFSYVGASFQLALPRQDGILSPQETRWNLVATRDTMKSFRHKRHRRLILNWLRTGGSDLIGRCRVMQRQGKSDRQKSLWIENAARHRTRDVSPDGVHPPRAENIPQILLKRLLQRAASEGSFSHWEKGTKTAKAETASRSSGGSATRRCHVCHRSSPQCPAPSLRRLLSARLCRRRRRLAHTPPGCG